MSFNNFDTLPHGASKSIKPFKVDIPQQDLDSLTTLLKLSPLPPPTYENSLPEGGEPRLGVRRDWLSTAKRYWETEFDWRKCEKHINSFPHFKAPISIPIHAADDNELGDRGRDRGNRGDSEFEIHFVALFSQRHDAIPILLLHGWPGSFLDSSRSSTISVRSTHPGHYRTTSSCPACRATHSPHRHHQTKTSAQTTPRGSSTHSPPPRWASSRTWSKAATWADALLGSSQRPTLVAKPSI